MYSDVPRLLWSCSYNCCKLWSWWCLRVPSLTTQIWSLWLLPTCARLMANQFIKIPCFDSTCQTSNTYWILLVCIDAKKDLLCHVGNHQLSAVLCHDPWADLMPPKAKPDLGFVKNRICGPCWNQNSLCCSFAALSNLKFGVVPYCFLIHGISIRLKFLNIP